jgi:SAM-dependent methyltransferase
LKYALLLAPSANRVYTRSAAGLASSELEAFGTKVEDTTVLGGLSYLVFDADPESLPRLANLSSMYAVFELHGEDMLRPVEAPPLARYDDDLLTIQKYAGKTQEHFTKLLLNVTVLASGRPLDGRLTVFDPMCGRGTTLNQALMYGYDAFGVDVDGKDFEAYSGFLRTWLRNKRLKHTAETVPVRRERALVGRRLDVTFALSKEAYKAGDVQRVSVVNTDTLRSREVFKPRSFDVIATDAPYGVQHGSKGGRGLSRSPLELLRQAVPVWAELLRPGGALGIAWNTYGGDRDDLAAVLGAAGLDVVAYPDFEHWVDQAIVRDIMVARKP